MGFSPGPPVYSRSQKKYTLAQLMFLWLDMMMASWCLFKVFCWQLVDVIMTWWCHHDLMMSPWYDDVIIGSSYLRNPVGNLMMSSSHDDIIRPPTGIKQRRHQATNRSIYRLTFSAGINPLSCSDKVFKINIFNILSPRHKNASHYDYTLFFWLP